MRTKTRGCKARLSKIPPTASTMAVRVLNHLPSCSEAHPDTSVCDTTVNEAQGDSIDSLTPKTSSSDSDGLKHDDLAPRSSGKTVVLSKKGHNSGPGISLKKRWKQRVTCIKCDKGGHVLICSDSGCPLAVHEKCIRCSPSFDDMGNFYCPYCSYKRAAAESDQAREKAMLAKKALSNFIDTMTDGRRAKRIEPNSSTIARDRKDRDNKNKITSDEVPNQSVPAEEDQQECASASDCTASVIPIKGAEAFLRNEQNDVFFGRHGDNAKLTECCQPTTVVEQEMCPKTSVAHVSDTFRQEETTPANESFQASITKGKINSAKNSETHQSVVADVGENIQAEHSGQFDDHQPEEAAEDQQEAEETVDTPRKSSSELNTSAEANASDQDKKVSSSKSRQLQDPSKRFASSSFSNVRRKKLPWTAEEEEMLKEGVQKFSTTVKKNLPWRKILEFGRHIFDGTRTPVDLKDKWRNILGKGSSAINRRLQ
ncbi:hypothetical protein L1049_024537 [Liquidambar formosana]|uniref:Myb-like domain-containing protein n=1 Tax=Liquidambar formosana TaxID=63359 RepID=A0AAP0S0S4_LIQFO